MKDNVSLTVHQNSTGRGSDSLLLRLPVALSRALQAKGYNRVRIEIRPDGILLKPYIGSRGEGQKATLDIPDWENQ